MWHCSECLFSNVIQLYVWLWMYINYGLLPKTKWVGTMLMSLFQCDLASWKRSNCYNFAWSESVHTPQSSSQQKARTSSLLSMVIVCSTMSSARNFPTGASRISWLMPSPASFRLNRSPSSASSGKGYTPLGQTIWAEKVLRRWWSMPTSKSLASNGILGKWKRTTISTEKRCQDLKGLCHWTEISDC